MVKKADEDAGLPAALRYSKIIDGLLSSLFQMLESSLIAEGLQVPLGLAAVGSYGREEPALHSDLDVRLISTAKVDKVRPIAEARLYPLWDAGLTLGHQVVHPNEMLDLAHTDLPTATTLLDWRVVVGDRTVSEKLLTRAFEGLFGIGNISGLESIIWPSKCSGRSYRCAVALVAFNTSIAMGRFGTIPLTSATVRVKSTSG
jgi:UTP:GlnB (protein PII) uridylyltransferase